MTKEKFYSMEECYNGHGLKTKIVWYAAFDAAPLKQIKYIKMY